MQSKPLSETETKPEVIQEGTGDAVAPAEGTPATVPPATPTPPKTPPATVTPDEPDYRGKFAMSTREAQALAGELEGVSKQLGEITKEEIPTDEEMVKEYPEYEFADDFQRGILKRQAVQDRRLKAVHLSVTRMLGSVNRRNEIASAIATKSALHGKEEAFVEFASDPRRQNAPVETLVSAFLFEVKDETPAPSPAPAPAPEAPAPTPAPAEPSPAPALERGTPSGGEALSAPTNERTPEELKALRTSDPREYNRLVREGKI